MGVNVDLSPSQMLEINLFMRFLREVELEDVNLLVHRNTWYHLNGVSMSRIDRVLLSEEWLWVCGEMCPVGFFLEMCQTIVHWN